MEVRQFLDALQEAEKRGLIGTKGAYASEGLQPYSHGFFGMCGDNDLIAAYVDGSPFADWLYWEADKFERKTVKLVTSRGPTGPEATPTSGVMTGVCRDCNSIQYEICEIDHDKGLLCRKGMEVSVLDIGYGYCQDPPMYRLDGTLIENDAEWQAAMAAEVLAMDVEEMLVQGNRANAYEADGLELLIKTGYTDCRRGSACEALDSILVDWDGDGLAGAVNGHGNIISKITDIVRRFKLRGGKGRVNVARDVVIMLPTHLRDALVDYWGAFGTGAFLVTGQIQLDATVLFERRESFIKGGLYGDGWVPVDGVPVSIIANDFIPFSGHEGNCSDIYVLTRQVGGIRAMAGAYQDFTQAAAVAAVRFGADVYRATDGGKFLIAQERSQNACFETKIYTRPALIVRMPYVQARIYDVCVTPQFTPVSKQPGSGYFMYSAQSSSETGDLPCYA